MSDKTLFWGVIASDQMDGCSFAGDDMRAVQIQLPQSVYGYDFSPRADVNELINDIRRNMADESPDNKITIFQFYVPSHQMEALLQAAGGTGTSYTVYALEYFELRSV